ncbi:syndecan-like [Homarus americanus]|uniref:syndecan-like n=1 Tax=Homarus americanus TaxID=6706 RepID=UPI001C452C1A|nr:syndecan-like [Homarus americanus]
MGNRDVHTASDLDLYLEDYGSGDGPDLVEGPGLTHIDHEGSGHGSRDHPYGATYDDTEDDDYYDEYDARYTPDDDDSFHEGSGTMIIDDDDELDDLPDQADITEVIEEISVEERPTVEELPPTTPPPTLTDNSDMDSPIQIHTTKTDDRQVSIFAQPGILAAFIGGAVVGLLCAILLVMFIVYRMRKKDEGSYPLDEPKRMPLTSSYSPNDKEIYA